jgi:hypothetical protein
VSPLSVVLSGLSLLTPLESFARTGLQRAAVVDPKVIRLVHHSRLMLLN